MPNEPLVGIPLIRATAQQVGEIAGEHYHAQIERLRMRYERAYHKEEQAQKELLEVYHQHPAYTDEGKAASAHIRAKIARYKSIMQKCLSNMNDIGYTTRLRKNRFHLHLERLKESQS